MPDTLDRYPSEAAIVGVDVGGTKTHLRAIVDGDIVDRVVPSDLWRAGAIFDDVQNFDRKMDGMTICGCSIRTNAKLVNYVAMSNRQNKKRSLENDCRRRIFSFTS